ncbi:MAG: hypothetical protein AVDCRST_MAG02-1316, partial [uncultured Rubrobacteraceae bacterium]
CDSSWSPPRCAPPPWPGWRGRPRSGWRPRAILPGRRWLPWRGTSRASSGRSRPWSRRQPAMRSGGRASVGCPPTRSATPTTASATSSAMRARSLATGRPSPWTAASGTTPTTSSSPSPAATDPSPTASARANPVKVST